MADDVYGLTKGQHGRLHEMLIWFEMRRHTEGPFNRRGKLPPVMDSRGTGYLTGAMSTGTASVTVDDVNTIYGPSLVASSAETVTIYNTHGWEGDNNGFARFEWNRSSSHFEIYAIDCPAST